MTSNVISKILEINDCNKDVLLKVFYKPKFWELISPVNEIEATSVAPNVIHTKITDDLKLSVGDLLKIPINMEGEIVFEDKGEEGSKGTLIEFNVRENEDVRELEGRIRVKALSFKKVKIGVFINHFTLSSTFVNLIKGAGEMILRVKVSALLRNLEKYCKNHDLKDIL